MRDLRTDPHAALDNTQMTHKKRETICVKSTQDSEDLTKRKGYSLSTKQARFYNRQLGL